MSNHLPKTLLPHPRPTSGDSCTVPYSCLAVAAQLVRDGYPVEILDEFSTPNYLDRLRNLISSAFHALQVIKLNPQFVVRQAFLERRLGRLGVFAWSGSTSQLITAGSGD